MSATPSGDYVDPMTAVYGLPPPYPVDGTAAAPSAPAAAPETNPSFAACAAPPAYPTPDSYPPGEAPPQMTTPGAYPTPMPASAVGTPASGVGGRCLMYFGVKDTVFCRDLSVKDVDGKSKVVWQTTVGEASSVLHFNDLYVACSSGIVIARLLKKLVGLDALTGAVKWSAEFDSTGLYDMITFVLDGLVLFAGCKKTLLAFSVLDGHIIWQHKLSKLAAIPLMTIAICGMNVFAATSNNMVLLNKADGAVRWDVSFPFFGTPSGNPMTAAWDGADTLMIGSGGYIWPVDLRNGELKQKINMKGTGYYDVGLIFDAGRRVFYALTHGQLMALSSDGTIRWVASGLSMGLFPGLGFDPTFGRIFIFERDEFSCWDTDGNKIFHKKYDIPLLCRRGCIIVPDLSGTGKIYLCSYGHLMVVDGEGNIVEQDELKGMGYNQVFACTLTATMDTNANADRCHYHEYRRPKN